MIIESGTNYPVSSTRLKKAIKECLKRFKSSYGFKHRAITAILTTLHQSNPFGRMHSSASMTARHYINKNDEKLLDEAFKIGISFSFTESIRSAI